MDVESKADDSYIDDVKEYVLQTFLDESDSNDLFINQFIDLIDQIQTTHGYTVDVIYCANILSEPASEVRAIIDYLRTNGVNVVGVGWAMKSPTNSFAIPSGSKLLPITGTIFTELLCLPIQSPQTCTPLIR